jgi:hypothetical protein
MACFSNPKALNTRLAYLWCDSSGSLARLATDFGDMGDSVDGKDTRSALEEQQINLGAAICLN